MDAVKIAKKGDLFPDLTEAEKSYNEGYVAGEIAERGKHGMAAVMYFKEKNRMCESNSGCIGCPFEDLISVRQFQDETTACDIVEYDDPAEAVRIVEEWSKAHPIQTRREKYKEVFGSEPLSFCSPSLGYPREWWDMPYEAPKGE